jgi:hypothetical protein
MTLLVIVAALFCSGCGKKGDPRPPKSAYSQGAADFIRR